MVYFDADGVVMGVSDITAIGSATQCGEDDESGRLSTGGRSQEQPGPYQCQVLSVVDLWIIVQ